MAVKESQEKTVREYKKYQRVGVFVDIQNMFYSAKYQYNAKLNFAKLLELAVAGRQLIRAICYVIQTPEIDQTNFLDMLQKNGFEIKSKDLRVRPDKSSKGDWDMGIAIDAISMVDKLDVVVLVSGDGDFVDLVHLLKSRGVIVEIISFPKSTNEDLIKAGNFFTPVDEALLIMDTRNHEKYQKRPGRKESDH